MSRPVAPNTACVVQAATAFQSVSPGQPVWMGLRAANNTAVSAIFYDDSSGSGDGQVDVINVMIAPASNITRIEGPFFVACGLYVGNISGGSAILWTRKPA